MATLGGKFVKKPVYLDVRYFGHAMQVLGVKKAEKITHNLSFSKNWLESGQNCIYSQNSGKKWVKMSEKRLMLLRGPLDLILTEIFVISSQFRSRKVGFPKYHIPLNLERTLLFCGEGKDWENAKRRLEAPQPRLRTLKQCRDFITGRAAFFSDFKQ